MTRPRRSQLARRRLAAIASLVWLVGFEVLPNLHLAWHDRMGAHHHDGDAPASDALTVRVHARGSSAEASLHVHDGAVHRHDLAVHDAAGFVDHDAVAGDRGAPRTPLGHGQHSLAHRSLAFASPPPVLVHPLPVDHVVVPVAHAVAQLVAIAPPPEAAARAPPG